MLHTRFCAVKTNDARFCKERQKETPYRVKRYGVLWTRRESNPRPFGCEPNALPTELRAHEKAPNFEWGQMSYNTRSGMQRLHSQLSYRPIFRGVTRLGDQPTYSPFECPQLCGAQKRYACTPMRTLKKPPKDKTFLWENGKKYRCNAVFQTSITFEKKLPFLLQCKKVTLQERCASDVI